ncbi:MAG: hypothetical protein Q8N23_19395 [Archangium sp.]|nr:hypothetical protein [Archangium sp.]MDP3154852.1 hypothetical protein [Archangium sp.]MDP3575012.1 hypothetical protein [Archangium sp.]
MTTSTKQGAEAAASQVRLARVELVRDERVPKETRVVVRVGEFCVELLSGHGSVLRL